MYIGIFRLILIIFSSAVAGMNVFNIMSAKANNSSMQPSLLTFLAMLAIIALMLVSQYIQNRKSRKEHEN